MSIPFNLGVLQLSMEPVRETVAMAKACEQAGFDAFWIAEAYPWWRKHSFEARSSTAILAVIAQETQRIQLGWGIISLTRGIRCRSPWKLESCRISRETGFCWV